MTKDVDTVKDMFSADTNRNIFKNYIEHIRFPFYKSFTKDLKINFTYPITFLVGPNGTGKSDVATLIHT